MASPLCPKLYHRPTKYFLDISNLHGLNRIDPYPGLLHSCSFAFLCGQWQHIHPSVLVGHPEVMPDSSPSVSFACHLCVIHHLLPIAITTFCKVPSSHPRLKSQSTTWVSICSLYPFLHFPYIQTLFLSSP